MIFRNGDGRLGFASGEDAFMYSFEMSGDALFPAYDYSCNAPGTVSDSLWRYYRIDVLQ